MIEQVTPDSLQEGRGQLVVTQLTLEYDLHLCCEHTPGEERKLSMYIKLYEHAQRTVHVHCFL